MSSAIKVMLIRPPQKFFHARYPRGPRSSLPGGLIAIGSFLKRRGIEVRLYDAIVENPTFETGEAGEPVHFGARWDEIHDALAEWRPDIVGITNIFMETMAESGTIAAIARAALPDATIVLGGPNATARADHILETMPDVDLIGVGDGEDTMVELVEWRDGRRALSSIANLVYRDGNAIRHTERRVLPQDLDGLGLPDYDLVKMERYFDLERSGILARNRFHYADSDRSVAIITSRGCPYYCSFCSIHIHAGRKYRIWSAEAVVDHLEILVRTYGVKHVHFEDDNLTLDGKRFMAILDGILERGLVFTWDTPNGVHANTLSEDLLLKMKKAGCTYLIVAVESGDQWVVDNVVKKKPMLLTNVLEAFRSAKRVGLDLQAFYIIGFPREERRHIEATLNFALTGLKRYGVIPHLAVARADHGTDLFNEAQELGVLSERRDIRNAYGVHIDRFARHVINTDQFTVEDLEAWSDRYHRLFIRRMAVDIAWFHLRHPRIALGNLRHFVRAMTDLRLSFKESAIYLFFGRLSYPQALLRESWLAGGRSGAVGGGKDQPPIRTRTWARAERARASRS